MERLQATTGLNKGGTFHPNAIHYSAVPWLAFTDMKHPSNMRSGDSVPKISTGKYFREGEKPDAPHFRHLSSRTDGWLSCCQVY